MIRCTKCKIWKDPSEYWVKRAASKTGYQHNCKQCQRVRARARYRQRQIGPLQGFATMSQAEFWGQVHATTARRLPFSGRM